MSPVQVLAVVGMVVLVSATAVTLHVEQTQRDNQAYEARAAQEARVAAAAEHLDHELRVHREQIVQPAHDGRNAAAALRILVAETVTGWERDDETVRDDLDRRLDELQHAAEQLAAAEIQPSPAPPGALPTTAAAPILTRLDAVGQQMSATSTRLHDAAAAGRRIGVAALELHVAAARFVDAGAELPDSRDPDVLAAAWRGELDRLDAYRDAVEAAAEVPALEALAAAHRDLVDDVAAFAEAAVDHLDADDVDAYNEHLESTRDELPDHGDALVEAMEATLPQAVAELEAAEEHALGLLNELEHLRRETAGQLAAATRG